MGSVCVNSPVLLGTGLVKELFGENTRVGSVELTTITNIVQAHLSPSYYSDKIGGTSVRGYPAKMSGNPYNPFHICFRMSEFSHYQRFPGGSGH